MLAKYFEWALTQADCRAMKVIEVGCGTGIAGLSLALKGAHVTLTDLPELQERVMSNIARNQSAIEASGGSVCFKVLNWDKLSEWDNSTTFDLVIGTDCVWHPTFIKGFTNALVLLCAKDPAKCKALVAHKVRWDALGDPFFAHLSEHGLQRVQVPREKLHPDAIDEVSDIWELRLAPPSSRAAGSG